MKRYLYLGKYTAEGLKGLATEGGTKRREAIEQLAASIGGKVVEYQLAIGEYDFIVIMDAPDEAAGLVAPIMAGSSGTVHVVTVPLVSPETLDEVAKRIASASFRPAGH